MHSLLQLQLFLIIHKKMSLDQLLYLLILLLVLQKKPGTPGFITKVGGLKVKCVERERQALLEFKKQVKDENGTLSSWKSGDCCLWRGVGCDNRTGHITLLDLHAEDYYLALRGKISNSLHDLKHLNYLDLSSNEFRDAFPNFIGSLSKLRYLNLSYNYLVSTLSTDQFGNLSRLQTLDLGYNSEVYFETLDWLSHLSSLEYLDLSWINLSMASDWFQGVSNVPHLKTLHLSWCNLSIVNSPSLSFPNYSKSLSVLDLSINNLTSSIYPWLYIFRNSLVDIDLRTNHLQGSIPTIFGEMCNLHSLQLCENNLSGLLSESIQNLYGCTEASLEILIVCSNELYGSLPDITRFSSMRELDLSSNQLNGSLPKRFRQIRQPSKLVTLSLQGNKLTGSIPDLTVFPSLTFLTISQNQLDGTVSESIGTIGELQYLDFSQNSLQGVIHEAHFSNLSKLRYLDLSQSSLAFEFQVDWVPPFRLETLHLASCNLGPRFPKWLQTQTNVSHLDISNAGISETIPDWFWDLSPNLLSLNLSHNLIQGMLPNLSSKYTSFIEIDLSSNRFEGPLPLFPAKMTSLNLSKNLFSGPISSICQILGRVLNFLDLSSNLLFERFPNCFMQFPILNILNLSNNNLSGKIPFSIGSLASLKTLSLRNNSLYGELPSLNSCRELNFLDLSENRLSGEIPAWLGESLPFLVFLSLQANEFSGFIPYQLCQLKSIQILDLSQNNISGTIPKCLSNLTAMVEKGESENIIQKGFIHSVDSVYQPHYITMVFVEWKGSEYEYGRNLGLLRGIDLSGNRLTGEIPEEINGLLQLMALNLSRNYLAGLIPQKIGQLNQLESLDLSRNRLSGAIPMSMADLNFLSHLDLSYNNLTGRIPTSTQLQSFDASSFIGNLALCGLPLTPTCPRDGPLSPPTNAEDGEDDFMEWFYIGMGAGFSACFLGVLGALLLKPSWRSPYFRFLDESCDWFYVTIALFKAGLERKRKS